MAETGHAINIAHFNDLISAVSQIDNYKPSNDALKVAGLQSLLATAKGDVVALDQARAGLSAAENNRSALFEPLDTLTRRILSSARSAGATPGQMADLEESARKIKGERAGTKNPDPVDPSDPHSISVSQQSFVNLAAHLSGLIAALGNIPAYAPEESDLKIASLEAHQMYMTGANAAVPKAEQAVTKTKNNRDASMYAEGTGLVDTATRVKEYVFSSSPQGAKNPDYKIVKAISFTRPRKK